MTTATAPAKPRPGTQQATVLAVAATLDRDAGFTFADLAVALWEHSPQVFGLRGFEERFPDTKTAALAFYDFRRTYPDLIEAPGGGRYKLTAAGVGAA